MILTLINSFTASARSSSTPGFGSHPAPPGRSVRRMCAALDGGSGTSKRRAFRDVSAPTKEQPDDAPDNSSTREDHRRAAPGGGGQPRDPGRPTNGPQPVYDPDRIRFSSWRRAPARQGAERAYRAYRRRATPPVPGPPPRRLRGGVVAGGSAARGQPVFRSGSDSGTREGRAHMRIWLERDQDLGYAVVSVPDPAGAGPRRAASLWARAISHLPRRLRRADLAVSGPRPGKLGAGGTPTDGPRRAYLHAQRCAACRTSALSDVMAPGMEPVLRPRILAESWRRAVSCTRSIFSGVPPVSAAPFAPTRRMAIPNRSGSDHNLGCSCSKAIGGSGGGRCC